MYAIFVVHFRVNQNQIGLDADKKLIFCLCERERCDDKQNRTGKRQQTNNPVSLRHVYISPNPLRPAAYVLSLVRPSWQLPGSYKPPFYARIANAAGSRTDRHIAPPRRPTQSGV